MRSRVWRRNLRGSSPRTWTDPDDGSSPPVMRRIVVVLPAPLGPITPRVVPKGTVSDSPSSATKCPKRFTASVITIALPAPDRVGPDGLPGARDSPDNIDRRLHE